MAVDRLFFYSIFGLGFGVYIFFKSFCTYREKKMIENTPTSKVRSLAMGRVEVYGNVVPDKNNVVKTPFSNQECVFCLWRIEEYKRSGKSSRWVIIKKGLKGGHFFIKDDTGIVLVDPNGARIEIPSSFQFETGIGKEPDKHIISFCEEIGLPHKGLIFNKKLKFIEQAIREDNKLYIMGYAGDNPYVEDGSAEKNEADIMIQKGNSSFYYISNKPEKEILKSYGLRLLGGLLGGGALIIVCLFYIFFYLRIL
ncbi:hypothetical protein JW930_03285 [Candidatus Woesearchaeota archaeon]|nr:hypothetical protein [Candidatus Woesearchaeota archaeon]